MRGGLEVHPDELLHRARAGDRLSWDEQAHVDVHLRACGTCRFLLNAGRAFDAEAATPFTIDMQKLVQRVVRGTSADSGRPARTPARRAAAVAVATVVMLGGVAFAGYWGARHPPQRITTAGASVAAPATATAPARNHAAGPPAAPPLTVPVEPPSAPSSVRSSQAPVRHVALARARAASRTAAALFVTANRARRMGDVAGARSAYDELWASFPGTPEALASRAIYGRWMLDRAEPNLAIWLFQQYLTADPSGELAEEALVGLAVAHERVGAADRAAATWRRLLSEHPRSVHGARARERIRILDGGTT